MAHMFPRIIKQLTSEDIDYMNRCWFAILNDEHYHQERSKICSFISALLNG